MHGPGNACRCAARLLSLAALALLVAACAGTRGSGSASGGGGYYMDDGPGSAAPADVASIADAVPRHEPVRAANSRPYEVFGQRYVPMRARTPYRETGIASWYGRKFHGNATASGERYDMYAMTAAHRTLPLPSYVRVTNLSNQRSVVVRVNDRGPFVKNRLIDLSWTAAKKLDFIKDGHTRVRVELVLPGEGPAAQEEMLAAAPWPSAPAAPLVSVAPAIAAPAVEPVATPAPRHETASMPTVPPVPRGFVLVDDEPASAARPEPPAGGFGRVDNEAQAGGFVRVDNEPQHGGFARVDTEPQRGGFVPVDAGAAAVAATPAGTAVQAGDIYLQLGAFRARDSATAALSDLGRRLAWLGDAISLHVENGQYKVQAGPWADAAGAEQAAARIRAEARIEPFAVRREAPR